MDRSHDGTGFTDIQVVGALKEGRREPHQAPTPKGRNATAHDHMEGRLLFKEEGHRRCQAWRIFGRDGVKAAANRLLNRQHDHCGEQDAGDAQHQEGRMPAIFISDKACHIRAEPSANGRTQRKDGHGHRATVGWEIVTDNGVAGGRSARLANTHPNAGQQKLKIVGRQAAEGGHGRPDRDRNGQEIATIIAVGNPRQGNAHGHIEQGQ